MLDPIRPFQIKTPLRGYDDLFDQLTGSIPAGDFYDTNLGYPIVAWSVKPVGFFLETNIPGIPIQVETMRIGDYHPGVDEGNLVKSVYFVPELDRTFFQVSLGLGLNRIIATELVPNGRVAILDVMATPNAVLFEPFGREIFKPVNIYNQQKNAIYSAYATRLSDQVIKFRDLLSEIQSLKILSTKMLIRSNVHFPGRQIGLKDFIQSFSFNTPEFVSMRASSTYDIEESRIQRVQQNSAGMEAHIWFPNRAVTRWLAFTRMADSFRNHYKFKNIRDDKVELVYKGKHQTHLFDYDSAGANFLTNLSITDCFENIDMFMSSQINSRYFFFMWTYTFDLFISDPSPLADPVLDPWGDGWVGYSLTGRFDTDTIGGLDSSVQPALFAPRNFTVSIGSPALFTLTSHGFVGGERIQLLTTGSLPTGLTTQQDYFVLYVDSNTFSVATTPGGTALNTTGTQSGTHSIAMNLYGSGDTPGLAVYYKGPYTQCFNTMSTDVDFTCPIGASGTLENYVAGSINHLAIDFPLNLTDLSVGDSYSVVVKFADSNNQTVSSGTGMIQIEESNGGTIQNVTVLSNGYVLATITPTQTGSIYWSLSSGSLTGQSLVFNVT
jgi:hypothetical protein